MTMTLQAGGRARLGMFSAPNLWAPLVLLACGAFMFVDLRTIPIVLWDESRLAVNALEMSRSGFGLVTTYDFQPDLWNTKPPLLIWLMSACVRLFGPGELAVRLPSMAASIGTLAVVMAFTRRMTGSAWAGALATGLLALSPAFFGEHGARTGDYDALLCFFTTSYLCVLFFALHRAPPAGRRLVLAGALVAAAVLTKSVAGLVPGAGFALYLLVAKRFGRVFASPRTIAYAVAAAMVAAVPVAAFYLLREAAAPGYLAAVWYNDVSGRFMTALDQHHGPPWYYLRLCFGFGLFSAGPLVVFVPFALRFATGKTRQALLFALCAAAGVIGVVSLSSTKLPQYVLTAVPFLAVATAIAAHAAVRHLKQRSPEGGSPLTASGARVAIVALVALLVVGRAVLFRAVVFPGLEFYPQALYGELFADLARQGVSRVEVAEHGVETIGVSKGYAPQLRFYALAAAEQGLTVETTAEAPDLSSPGVKATCDPHFVEAVSKAGAPLAHPAGCAAVRVGP